MVLGHTEGHTDTHFQMLRPTLQSKAAKLIVSWREARNSIRRLVTGGTGRDGAAGAAAPNTKLSITRSFFELQSPDFAWKLIWTVQTNFEKILKITMSAKKQNGCQIAKLSLTHSFL